MRHWLVGFLAVLVAASHAAVAAGQGGILPTKEELARVPVWKPEPEGAGEFPRVDLRPYLPPVGDQGRQNSCVGWALAYTCKSYQESRARNWDLNGSPPADRLFSPAFVYNRINGGKDRGANIIRAAQLVTDHGCATLATMPYDAGNYTAEPAAAALREAKLYRGGGYTRLTGGGLIRAALRQGYAVPVIVQTDPEFCSGLHDVFRREHRQAGVKARRPEDPHSYHAMCVVGYDDAKKAFLLMNSWGERWGRQGYCWVDYELMKAANLDDDTFLQTAIVLNRPDRSFSAADAGEPAARLAARYTGYEGGQHTWAWKASLEGPEALLRGVTKVVWSKPGAGGPLTSTDPASGFAVNGSARGTGALLVTGEVHLADKSVVEVKGKVDRKAPAVRRLVLVAADRYWGRRDGGDRWQFTLRVRGNYADVADVKHVAYHLDRAAPNPDPVVTGSADDGFAFTGTAAKGYPVRAEVTFRDGATLDLQTTLRFRDPPREGLSVGSSVRALGVQDEKGRDRYHWDISLDGPVQQLRQVSSVVYRLPAAGGHSAEEGRPSPEQGFPLSGTAWGEPRVRAKVTYKTGKSEELILDLRPPKAASR